MILGGREQDDSLSKVVEEVDFIKRNLVALPPLKAGRANACAFQVNDVIYVFGGTDGVAMDNTEMPSEIPIGEKLALRENRWREVVSRSGKSSAARTVTSQLLTPGNRFGPISLMYE
jgi:hypothetical protein